MSPNRLAARLALRLSSRWSVPRNFATARAYNDSSKDDSAKEIEKVFTGSDEERTARAAIVEESTPPESKTPSGTSDTKRIRTESASRSRRCSAASASEGGGWLVL